MHRMQHILVYIGEQTSDAYICKITIDTTLSTNDSSAIHEQARRII